MFYKFNFIKICFLVMCITFSFMFLLSPNEVFAMEPSPDFVTNYYGGKEYVGTDPYLYFHPDPAPDIDTIQSKTSTPYGTPIKDD